MNKIIYLFCIILFCLVSTYTSGQDRSIPDDPDSTQTYKVEMIDGTVFLGNILKSDSQMILMKTSLLTKIEIPKIKIKSVTRVEKSSMVNGIYWFPNPNATRYLFSPSAFNLKKGEGYYQNTYLLINSFNVGVTDNFSIGGGFELLSTFGTLASGNFQPIFFITPKVGFKVTENFHAGGGILYASIPDFDNGDERLEGGLAYGIGTLGSIEHNFTGGIGWGFFDGDFSNQPFITFSGMTRVSKKAALITENWLGPDNGNYYGVFSYGVRFFGETISVDLAFINNSDIAEEIIIGIPYVDFVVKF